jgi:hypothetical protein
LCACLVFLPFLVVVWTSTTKRKTIYYKAARRRQLNLKTYWTIQCSRMLKYNINSGRLKGSSIFKYGNGLKNWSSQMIMVTKIMMTTELHWCLIWAYELYPSCRRNNTTRMTCLSKCPTRAKQTQFHIHSSACSLVCVRFIACRIRT